MRPNLFRFATSELSQDAVLCWILAWADPRHEGEFPALHRFGARVLSTLFERAGRAMPALEKVEVGRQSDRIDVWAVVNDRIPVIIEDKVGTFQHSDQLERYLAAARTWGLAEEPVPIYLQTGDQWYYEGVIAAGYGVVDRKALLGLFQSDAGRAALAESEVLREYATYLADLEAQTDSYRSAPLAEWEWGRPWFGFFEHLRQELGQGGWGAVNAPSGTFEAFWWGAEQYNEAVEAYMQLEADKLCFKIRVLAPEHDRRGHHRAEWSRHLIEAFSRNGMPVVRPGRFGSGETMTVAVWEGDYRVAGEREILDVRATVDRLRAVTSIFRRACEEKRGPQTTDALQVV